MTNVEGAVEDIETAHPPSTPNPNPHPTPPETSDHAVVSTSFKCKQESESPKIFYQYYDGTDFSGLGEMLDIEWDTIFQEQGCEGVVENSGQSFRKNTTQQ